MTLIRKEPDPVNEALRQDVEGPPNMDDAITALMEKTSNIHAGFLFETYGKEALQKLCQCVSGTRSSYHYKGWEDFGIRLGLNGLQINCIKFNFHHEDPATYTLQAFVQEQNSTLDKIISALRLMERFDIIVAVTDPFIRLVDEVIKRQRVPSEDDESGYYSLTSSQSLEETTENLNRINTIRPPFVPPVPFVLQKFGPISSQINNETAFFTSITNERKEYDSHQRNNIRNKSKTDRKVQYGKTVMLTFADDGQEAANQVAEIFRREKGGGQRIGVLILNDHKGKVNSNPEEFILSCFEQVDYVVPIITEGYLKAISTSTSMPNESSLLCLDPKYVKYIYTLMNTNYIRNGCINEKVRCVIPDKLVQLTYKHSLMCGPLFQAWVQQSETEQLKERMLNANF